MAQKFLFVGSDGLNAEALAPEDSDFITASTGVPDAGKPIKLDAGGKLDASF